MKRLIPLLAPVLFLFVTGCEKSGLEIGQDLQTSALENGNSQEGVSDEVDFRGGTISQSCNCTFDVIPLDEETAQTYIPIEFYYHGCPLPGSNDWCTLRMFPPNYHSEAILPMFANEGALNEIQYGIYAGSVSGGKCLNFRVEIQCFSGQEPVTRDFHISSDCFGKVADFSSKSKCELVNPWPAPQCEDAECFEG